jgi:xanthine/uracil permease
MPHTGPSSSLNPNLSDYLYALDDRLPLWSGLLYGLQWAAIMFPSLIIAAALAGQALGLDPQAQVRFLQLTLFVSGAFSMLQTLWGHRYPLLEGPATALLLTFIALASQGVQVIQGGLILGGLLLVVIGLLRGLDQMIRFFTPNVVGVILLLIAFTLLPHLMPHVIGADGAHPAGQVTVFGWSIMLVLVIAALSRWLQGFWQTLAMFLGVVVGTLLFAMLGRLDWQGVLAAPWVASPARWMPALPHFNWPAMLAFALAYLAVIVNSLGSIQGIANITDLKRLPASLNRGILVNGLAGVCCGLAGIVGTVSYSMSPGVVLVSRVASRFGITFCGGILVVAAFVPKLAALLALVPAPVVGAALCVGLGGQVGAGLAIITAHQRKLTGRDYLVVGVPVIVGTMVSILPHGFLAALPAAGQVFVGNGLIVGIVLVLSLEHLLLRQAGPKKG